MRILLSFELSIRFSTSVIILSKTLSISSLLWAIIRSISSKGSSIGSNRLALAGRKTHFFTRSFLQKDKCKQGRVGVRRWIIRDMRSIEDIARTVHALIYKRFVRQEFNFFLRRFTNLLLSIHFLVSKCAPQFSLSELHCLPTSTWRHFHSF